MKGYHKVLPAVRSSLTSMPPYLHLIWCPLQDAAKVVQKFMERDPGELRFTMVALAAPPRED